MNDEAVRDWWEQQLAECREDGRRDADGGQFDPPHYVTDDDPQYLAENMAYKEGFLKRRKELGDRFKWA